MKRISKLVAGIEDEIHGACNYAEKYIEAKIDGNSEWSARYKKMAEDELQHATYLHEMAVKEIEKASKVFKAPKEMQDKWDECHQKMIEKTKKIKEMLAM